MLLIEEKANLSGGSGFSKLSAWLIALAPIVGVYKFGPINASTGDVCLLVLLLFLIFRISIDKKIIFKQMPFFVGFIAFLFFSSGCSMLFQTTPDYGDFVNKWIKMITYYSLINLLVCYEIDKKLAINIVVNISVLLSIILFFQWIALRLNNSIVFPYLPYPPLYYNLELNELHQQAVRWASINIWRPSSIFAEPAGYAEYCILGIILLFFAENDSSKIVILKKIIIFVGILMSGSATGFFLLAGVILIWFKNKTQFKINILTLMGLLCVIIVSFIILQSDFFADAMIRLTSFNLEGGRTTANLRVLQGFFIYDQLPEINKIFGVGFGNLKNYLIEHSIVTSFLTDIGNESMSAVGTILNTSGILGLFLYCASYVRIWKLAKDLSSHVILIVLFLMFFTSNIFFTSLFITYFAFLCIDIYSIRRN